MYCVSSIKIHFSQNHLFHDWTDEGALASLDWLLQRKTSDAPKLFISNNDVVNTASHNLRSSTDRQLVQLKVAIDYRWLPAGI